MLCSALGQPCDRVLVLVVVVAVLGVTVPVMEIVHVVAVLHGFMCAIASAVCVLGESVLCFYFFSHDDSFHVVSSEPD